MTGTGTKYDPYLVESWEEFLSVCHVSDATGPEPYIKWADTASKTIDFSEEPVLTSEIAVKGTVDFNGLTIKNLSCTGHVIFSIRGETTIMGLNLANFHLNTTINGSDRRCSIIKYYSSSNVNTYVHDCTFKGQIVCHETDPLYVQNKTNPTPYVNPTTGIFTNTNYDFMQFYKNAVDIECSITVSKSSTTDDMFFTPHICLLDRCNAPHDNYIRIRDIGDFPLRLTNCHSDSVGSKMHDNFIDYEWNKTEISPHVYPTTVLDERYSYNNVFIFKSPQMLAGTGSHNIFNSDLAPNGVWKNDPPSSDAFIQPTLIPCTTEQLKNTEYLRSIGFPVGVK